MLAGTAAVAALAALSLGRYPANLHEPAAPVLLAALVVLLGLYGTLAVRALRRPGAGTAIGTLFGVAAAAMWAVEIWAGGPAMLGRALERAVGGTFALLAVLVTVAAGVVAALVCRDPGAAVRAGLFAGLASGLLVFCFGIVVTLSTLEVLGRRLDYQRQFVASNAPDMATFLVGDILAAVIAHLVINLVLGLVGGGIGELLWREHRRATLTA